MPHSNICIDCGQSCPIEQARWSRCPACQPAHAKRRNLKRGTAKSPDALARRAAHQRIVRSERWRQVAALVKERDGQCVRCGATGDLTVHHIIPAVEAPDPFDPANAVTLCRACHSTVEGARRRRSNASR